MHKGADAYRSIGEAARLVGVAPHVLRYWESQFPQLKPVRRPDGRRYYRPDDVRLAAGLAEALREEGLTTRGAARLIARDGGAGLRARGAARLPAVFALDEAAETAADLPADASAGPGIAAPARRPRAADRPRKTAPPAGAGALPLFPDHPPPADSPAAVTTAAAPAPSPLPLPLPLPLARLSHLAAHLHHARPAAADLRLAVAHLRAHLARRD